MSATAVSNLLHTIGTAVYCQ